MTRQQFMPILLAAMLSSMLTLAGVQLLTPTTGRAAQDNQGPVSLLRAQRVEIVDASGMVRGVLGLTPGGDAAGVIFRDEQGRERAGMGTGRPAWGVGPGAWVLDDAGRLRAAWGLAPDDTAAAFLVADETGQRRAGMGGTSELGYGVVVADESGAPRVGMGTLARGAEGYGMRVQDANGNLRLSLSGGANNSAISVLSADGRPVWRAP
jgi:hypothetical protein